MKSLYILLVVQFAIISSNSAAKLPGPCRKSDPGVSKCLLKALQQSLVTLRRGNSQYGVPSFEPLLVPHYEFTKKLTNVMEVRIVIRDLQIDGLTNTKISNFKFTPKNLTSEFDLQHPHILVKLNFQGFVQFGGYSTDNQANIAVSTDELKSHVSVSFNKTRDGKHFSISNLTLKLQVQRIQINATAKNPKDQEIFDLFLGAFNKDSKTYLATFEPVYTAAIQGILLREVNKFMLRIPATNILVD